CWASASRKALLGGAALASVAVTIVVFLFGFGGLLAVWGGVWQPNEDFTNTNTILFSLFNDTTWILVIATVLAVPNEDFTNTNTILFSLFNDTTSVIPVMAGVIPGKWSRWAITPFSVGFGCLSGIASLFIWTQIYSVKYDMSYSDSLYQVFLYAYDYPPFLMALGFSVAGMVVGAGCEAVARVVLKKEYPEFDLGSEELPEVQGGEMVDAGMEKLGMGDGDSAGVPMVSNS
ncbi:unnamed protein product, partial [Closterium sp. Naga37s-1]